MNTPKTITYKGKKYKVRYATNAGESGPALVCDTDELYGEFGDELPLAKVGLR